MIRPGTAFLLGVQSITIIIFGLYWMSPSSVERVAGWTSLAAALLSFSINAYRVLSETLTNHASRWATANIVEPIKSSVNLMLMAQSDKDIAEIKKRIKKLKEEMEKDKEFWKEFFAA